MQKMQLVFHLPTNIDAGIQTNSSLHRPTRKKTLLTAEIHGAYRISNFSWRKLRAIFNGVDDSIFALLAGLTGLGQNQ